MLALADKDLLRDALYINGEWRKPAAANALEVLNPATGIVVQSLPQGRREDAVAAIAAAEAAMPDWAGRTAKERSALLRRWHDLIIDNVDDLARILTAEQGKPVAEARGEIMFGAAFFEWFAEEAKRVSTARRYQRRAKISVYSFLDNRSAFAPRLHRGTFQWR